MVNQSESDALESEQSGELEPRRLDLEPGVAVAVSSDFILQVDRNRRDSRGGFAARKIGIFATADTPIRYSDEPTRQRETDQPNKITYATKTIDATRNSFLVGETKVVSLGKTGETFHLEIESQAPVTFFVAGHSLNPRDPQDQRLAQDLLKPKSAVYSTSPS